MKVLFITHNGELLPIARKVEAEGHLTYLYPARGKEVSVGEGLVRKPKFGRALVSGKGKVSEANVTTLLEEVTPALVVVDKGCGAIGDYIIEQNVKVVGGGGWSDLLDWSPEYGEQLLQRCHFPPGVGGLGGWWNGEDFTSTWLIERVWGFMNDGIGPQTLGGLVVKSSLRPLAQLEMLKDFLYKTTYKGPVGVDGKGLRCHLTLPLLAALVEVSNPIDGGRLVRDPILNCLVNGPILNGNKVGGSIRISLPPFPTEAEDDEPRRFILGDEVEKHVWLTNIERTEGDEEGCYAGRCSLGFASAWGKDIREVHRRIRRTTESLAEQLVNLQYRTDVFLNHSKLFISH